MDERVEADAGYEMRQQKANQLVGLGETLRHSTLQSHQTFSQIQCVTTSDLASNRYRIMRLYAGRTHFTHFCAVLNCILQPTGSS